MFDLLPPLNALLNSLSAILLVIGHRCIKTGRREAHRQYMTGAFIVSSLFLISYLTYHYHHGTTSFKGEGWARPVYFFILTTHTVLAASVVPLVIITLRRALKGNFEKHIPIARWTYPIWLYVSITGVVVYVMLYQLWPS